MLLPFENNDNQKYTSEGYRLPPSSSSVCEVSHTYYNADRSTYMTSYVLDDLLTNGSGVTCSPLCDKPIVSYDELKDNDILFNIW